MRATTLRPPGGIPKRSSFQAMHDRGLEQFTFVFQELQAQASSLFPLKFPELGDLIAIHCSLIDAVLSMHCADYRDGAKKAKTHIGFDVNRSIPRKIFLTDGNSGNALLSARSSNLVRPSSWTVATNATKILILGRLKKSTSSAASRPTPKELVWKVTRCLQAAWYFSMPRFF